MKRQGKEADDSVSAEGGGAANHGQVEIDPQSSLTSTRLFGLAKLYRRTGKRDEARGSLATATTMFREMDMRLWLEQAEAELKELG